MKEFANDVRRVRHRVCGRHRWPKTEHAEASSQSEQSYPAPKLRGIDTLLVRVPDRTG